MLDRSQVLINCLHTHQQEARQGTIQQLALGNFFINGKHITKTAHAAPLGLFGSRHRPSQLHHGRCTHSREDLPEILVRIISAFLSAAL